MAAGAVVGVKNHAQGGQRIGQDGRGDFLGAKPVASRRQLHERILGMAKHRRLAGFQSGEPMFEG